MNRNFYDLKSLLDIPLWEKVQDQLAEATGTAIITIDYKGTPITKHSKRTNFCSIIRENPVSRKRCYKCDALAGLEAVRLERPYIYLCHCGIVDVAVPVMVGDRYLGAVMFGQVRIANGDSENQVQRLVSEISSFQAETETTREDLLEKYNELPEMEYKRVVEIASLINSIVEYIVDRAIKSSNDRQTYEWLLNVGNDGGSAGGVIQELRDPSIDRLASKEKTSESVKIDSPLYPAIAYMKDHPAQPVSMKDMAELCHLSSSYFSRLFSRELGESFVTYTNRNKIERSKQLLRETSLSVSQIAIDVGYVDVSHFIQLFKRFEGVTPTVYKQYNYK